MKVTNLKVGNRIEFTALGMKRMSGKVYAGEPNFGETELMFMPDEQFWPMCVKAGYDVPENGFFIPGDEDDDHDVVITLLSQ